MKDFKLKTLAAVCLFTMSAYGMEESPESSSKASDPYLYVVPDEDLIEERLIEDRAEAIKQTRDSIVECIKEITESEELDLDEALEFVQSINEKIWRSMLPKFPVKGETLKEKKKYWIARLRHEFEESLEQVFPKHKELEYKTFSELYGRY